MVPETGVIMAGNKVLELQNHPTNTLAFILTFGTTDPSVESCGTREPKQEYTPD